MTTRKYSSISQETMLTAALSSTATTMVVNSASALMSSIVPGNTSPLETFTVVIDPDTALEEIVDVVYPSTGSNNTLTIQRSIDSSVAIAHSAGAKVRHMVIGRDLRESNAHIEASSAYNDGISTHSLHGLTSGDGDLVGTNKAQTLTSKTLTTPTIASFTNANHSHLDSAGGGLITTAAISGFQEAVEDTVGAMVSSNTEDGISVTYDDATGKYNFNVNDPLITIAGDVSGSATMTNLGDTTITVAIPSGTIVNSDVNSGAAIAKSKLDLGGTITSADLVDGTIVNSDINASAAIALSKLATDPLARANHTGTQTASTISDFDTQVRTSKLNQMAAPTADVALNAQKITGLADPTNAQDAVTLNYITTAKGAANGIASLDSSGLILQAQLPGVAITDTFVVASQTAMLALSAQVGDIAIRTDLHDSFILTATPASTLANWAELLTPTDAVTSVDSQTGAVSLSGTYLAKAGGTMTGVIAMGANKITGLGTPTATYDAATKAYVDAVAGSATAAAASATAAQNSFLAFDAEYLGAKSTAPTLNNQGNALATGTLYWNSTLGAMFAWAGSAWSTISSTAAIYRYRYTSTGGETSKSGVDDNGLTLSYITGKEQVYLNGVLLLRNTDYIATDGSSIASLAALTAGDVLEIITFTAFDLATSISNSLLTAKGDLLIATGASTPGKISVGSDNSMIVADSTTATGVKWATPQTVMNTLISYTTTATSAGTTTLTSTSTNQQFFTGTNSQTVVLPVASTMLLGQRFLIENNSTGALTIQSSGGNLVATVPGNVSAKITCILTSGTTAASWDADFVGNTAITGTGSMVLSTSPTLVTPTLGTATATKITSPLYASLDSSGKEVNIALMNIMGAY